MINFRFHIISLTAVFLAFAVGLVLGTTFLDDATERALNKQLDNLDDDLRDARHKNAELQSQLDRYAEEDEALQLSLGERMLGGTLANDPVLVIAAQGLDGDPVERVVESLTTAGADYVGAWRLTDRLVLDDDNEKADLATALDITADGDVDVDVERLTRDLSGALATALFHAIHQSDAETDIGQGLVGSPTEPAEPTRIAALHEQGFIDYQLPENSDSDVVLLPSSGLRVVVVTGEKGAVPSESVLLPTLTDLVSEGPAPVVVTAASATNDEDEETVDGVSRLISDVRDEGTLSERISTVDDLELVSGWLATSLATQQADPNAPKIGHYGLGPGAQELLPPVPATP
ncbi:MAG TPA: copper transporter [Acidimicrobiales bacterium]|jgi:hypothetical protein